MVEEYYENSLSRFVTVFLGEEELSKEEAEAIRKLL